MTHTKTTAARTIAGYDQLAPWYQTIERLRFGGGLQSARQALIPRIPPASRVLFVGDGDGRLLRVFAAAQPAAAITSVDISGRMLSLQQKRVASLGTPCNVHWIEADVLQQDFPENHFDLLVTAFFLDCFSEPMLWELMARMSSWITPTGLWYMSDFRLPDQGLRRRWASLSLKTMHFFFRWQTGLQSRRLFDPAPIFKTLGFHPISHQQFRGGTLQSVLYERKKAEPRRVGDGSDGCLAYAF